MSTVSKPVTDLPNDVEPQVGIDGLANELLGVRYECPVTGSGQHHDGQLRKATMQR